MLILALGIVLLAGPRKFEQPRSAREMTNIQFCIDVSGSMTGKFGDGDRYEAAIKVNASRKAATRSLRGETTAVSPFELSIPAVAGTTLKITMKGVSASPELEDPNGRVIPLTGKLRNGKFRLKKSGPLAVTGTWILRTTSTSSIKYKVVRTAPKRRGVTVLR